MSTASFGALMPMIEGLFPVWSSTRLARLLRVNPRTSQRWFSNRGAVDPETRHIPQDIQDRIGEQYALLSSTGFGPKLRSVVQDAVQAGLDPEIVGAWLAHEHLLVLEKEIG